MNPDAISRRAAPLLVCTGALLLATADTTVAKVSCEPGGMGKRVELADLPKRPVAGRTYELIMALPRAHAVNPNASVMALRCPHGEAGGHDAAGATPIAAPGKVTRTGSTAFELRLPRAGRWRIVSMDLSGTFRDHGFRLVHRRSSGTAGADESGSGIPPVALIAAGGVIALAGAALASGRRSRRAAPG